MSYDPNIPTDLPPPSVAVNQIRTNFSEFANVFDNNHVSLNANSEGKHANVILQRQSVDPTLGDSNFDVLYGKSVTSNSSTADQAYIRIPQFLPNEQLNTPMQLTFNSVSTVADYQSFLAGKYLIFWGTVPGAIIVNATITLSPQPTQIVCIIPNPTKFAAVGAIPTRPVPVFSTLLNNFQFRIESAQPGGTGDINWLAIARA
jgi:hypothetical protein